MKRMGFFAEMAGLIVLIVFFVSPAMCDGKEFKFGLTVPKSGWGAEEGVIEENGAMLAVEEINAAGGIKGIPIKMYVYDNGSNPTQSINVGKKLIYEDKVIVILGPAFSSQVEVTFPVANLGKTPIISALSSKPGISEKNRPWAFRNTMTSDKLYKSLVERWANDFKIKKVAIIYDAKDRFSQSDGTIVFPGALKELNIPIVTSVTYMTNDMDFSAQLTAIQRFQPDGIIIAGLRTEAAQIMKQARQKGMKTPFTGGLELVTPRFIELGGKDVEGTYIIHSMWISGNPDAKMVEFVEKVKKRTGKLANIGDLRMYDCVYINKYVIEKMGVTGKPEDLEKDRDKIREGWKTLKDYQGVEGKMSIDEKGDGVKENYLLVVKDGKFVRLH